MDHLKNCCNPQNTESTDAKPDDDDRAKSIPRTAQNSGENFNQSPCEVEGNEIQNKDMFFYDYFIEHKLTDDSWKGKMAAEGLGLLIVMLLAA